jgi:hypothetical protein
VTDADKTGSQEQPAPSGIASWVGSEVTLHLTGAGRVKSLTGELTDLAGDGFVIAEADADWWVPRGGVQAVQRATKDDV